MHAMIHSVMIFPRASVWYGRNNSDMEAASKTPSRVIQAEATTLSLVGLLRRSLLLRYLSDFEDTGEIHYREPFTISCLGLSAIRGDEKVRLIDESASNMEGIERPQGMIFETAKGLLEGILGEVTEISIGEVGLHGGFEVPIVLGGESAFAHQATKSGDQFGYDQDADSQRIRLGAEGSNLFRPLLLHIALG